MLLLIVVVTLVQGTSIHGSWLRWGTNLDAAVNMVLGGTVETTGLAILGIRS